MKCGNWWAGKEQAFYAASWRVTGAHGFEDAFWRLFSLNPVGGGGEEVFALFSAVSLVRLELLSDY